MSRSSSPRPQPNQPSPRKGPVTPRAASRQPTRNGTGDTRPGAGETHAVLSGTFGRYVIEGVLGEGGMGAVYLARDTMLNRQVALKVPKFNNNKDSEHAIARFYREARALATLHHPNICPVYDVGEEQGQHYISMAYIDGSPLSDYVDPAKPLPQSQAVKVLRKLARALQEAHTAGIVHRDLKSANIHVDRRGEPIVMDFGLALVEDTDVRVTQTGMIMGTPAYMPPEQVMGKLDEIGPRSDIFSLGVIFYELLTGTLPFEGPATSVIGQILTVDPPTPISRRPEIDPALQAICLTMIAKQQGDRYPDMQAVYATLTKWLKSGGELNVGDGLAMAADAAPGYSLQQPGRPNTLTRTQVNSQGPLPRAPGQRSIATQISGRTPPPPPPPGGASPARSRSKSRGSSGSNLPLILTMFVCTGIVVWVISLLMSRGTPVEDGTTTPASLAAGDQSTRGMQNVQGREVPTNPDADTTGDSTPPVAPLYPAQPSRAAPLYPGRGNEFVSLFNGNNLTGWTTIGASSSFWAVRDGNITLTQPVSKGWLSTVKSFDNFELQMEYRLPPGGNTGVFLRAAWDGSHDDSDRLEVQLLDDGHPRYWGLPPDRKNGAIYGIVPRSRPIQTAPREWHDLYISLRGSQVIVRINGSELVNRSLDDYTKELRDRGVIISRPGYIGFQAYGYPPEFRNIRIREF